MKFRRLITVITAVVLTATAMTSCHEEQVKDHNAMEADSLINVAYKMRDYEQLLSVVEMHHSRGSIADMKACYWRGYANSRLRHTRMAENAWREAITLDINNDEDLKYYTMAANRLAGLLYMKGNYEGTIRVAMRAIQNLKERGYTGNMDYSNILAFVGCCQVKLQRLDKAAQNFNDAWDQYLKATDDSEDISDYTGSLVGIISITDAYIQVGEYNMGYEWTRRLESMLDRYRDQPMADDDYIDKQWARLNFYKATALEGLGKKDEAAEVYHTAVKTHYAKTGDGQIEATTYLMKAGRWKEAADMFDVLEKQFQRYDLLTNLDNILLYLQPKYIANLNAGRRDTAVAISMSIMESIDSVIINERQNSAIEQSAIYETEGKERELAVQDAEQSQQQFIVVAIALILVVMVFALFLYYRHQASVRQEKSLRSISRNIHAPLSQILESAQRLTANQEPLSDDDRAKIDQDIKTSISAIASMIEKLKQGDRPPV